MVLSHNQDAWPVALKVSADRARMTVDYDSGETHPFTAEFLRVLTPSAERKGHGREMVIGGKKDVTIKDVTPVGGYAVRIHFSDGHDTGLYSFAYLKALGADTDTRWQGYLSDLGATGLSRGTAGRAPRP
ncbi:MAG: gamma-butyrobetaine hydroxylase-like domain-containing protein [Devosia sp.]